MREERQRNRETAELKRENHQLKRKVTQLRKRVEQLEALLGPEADASLPETNAAAARQDVCPACGSDDLAVLTTPSGVKIAICRDCPWRGSQ